MIKEYEIKVNLLEMMSDTDFDNDWDYIDSMVIDQFGEDVFQNKITSGYDYHDQILRNGMLILGFQSEENE